ncbi:unnamed protein product [Pseudo-nitzschia multistriata]|uniref:Uncharacterized protein n=1 Tax=Pseudo-nitzschia multistriata TaxID=183589 RepID=A0A448Z1V8_9STRA|nr:unnamed protein product [Pseudo-nitzschia multistriata]
MPDTDTIWNESTQLIPNTEESNGTPGNIDGKEINRSCSFIGSLAATAGGFSEHMSESMKRIGVLGSVSIAVNSLTGPAMLTLPATYQRSGFHLRYWL